MSNQKTSEQIVDGIIHAYYHEHHNLNTYRRQLSDAVGSRVDGFVDCKRRIIEAIDHQIAALRDGDDFLGRNAKLEVLTKTRAFVKGMVTTP